MAAFGHFDPITAEQNRRFMSWTPQEQMQGMALVGQGYRYTENDATIPAGADVKRFGAGGNSLAYYKPAAAPTPPPAAPASAPAPSVVTASGAGGSAAAQATTATKDRAEVSYRESLPATTHRQNPWKPGDHANNANLATQGMLDAARATQESTTRSADRFDAIALNSSQWMADIDSRNLNRLSCDLSLPKNPTDALRGFYEDISNDLRKTLGPFA